MTEGPLPLGDVLRTVVGQRIPGGCETCDAYQTVADDPEVPNHWHMTVHHDDG